MKNIFIICGLLTSGVLWSAPVTSGDVSEMGVNTMNVDAGLIVSDGSSAAGAEIGVGGRITNAAPLVLSGNLGAYLATENPTYVIFPILAGLHYEFPGWNTVHPLLGAMAGPVISTGPYDTNVDFEMLFRPGVNIDIGRTAYLNVEPRFGVLGSEFVVSPQIGATFRM